MEIHEIKAKLIEDYKEEIEDTHKYVHLSNEARTMGELLLAEMLYKIAHQEYKHAHMLREELINNFGYSAALDGITESKWLAIKKL